MPSTGFPSFGCGDLSMITAQCSSPIFVDLLSHYYWFSHGCTFHLAESLTRGLHKFHASFTITIILVCSNTAGKMTVPTTQLTISPVVYADPRSARRGRYSSPDGMKTPINDLCWSTYDAGQVTIFRFSGLTTPYSLAIPYVFLPKVDLTHFKLDRLNAINHCGTLAPVDAPNTAPCTRRSGIGVKPALRIHSHWQFEAQSSKVYIVLQTATVLPQVPWSGYVEFVIGARLITTQDRD
ncbi:hypothetical protein F5J12DRAFT_784021 [Pisolithus orientalis]|uniref:uncharacterized protein n=1 Tax=Pisolithus orientalis TaxID=936130 RepID=UPI00222472DC|nr:uncharacterized protein F5J12DRAFT_784021 [Pisolithus orientalis]KAI6002287.1 hypothetical protein F5J12DRAFT_784021 [Pisolithus orientalis]